MLAATVATVLFYISKLRDMQWNLMQLSHQKQVLQRQQSEKLSEMMQSFTREEELVRAEFGDEEDLTTEQYTQMLSKLSELNDSNNMEMNNFMAEIQAKESLIDQQIEVLEPQVQAVEADLKNLKELQSKEAEKVGDLGTAK